MKSKCFLYLFGICTSIRMCCLIAQNSYYVADEYWQSLEVAHRIVFGYGYLTWEWIHGIRSYIYVSWIALWFKLLQIFNLDSVQNLIMLPNIIQATLTAFSDACFIACAQKLYGSNQELVYWTVWPYITNVFLAYCATRTLINTVETNLSCICLYLYPVHYEERLKHYKYVWLVCLACVIRPTAAVFWAPLCLHHLLSSSQPVVTLFKHFMPKALIVLTASTVLDTYFQGKLIFTWWNFLKINVFQEISAHYSVHSVFWYFVIGLPVVLGPSICSFYTTIFSRVRKKYSRFEHDVLLQNSVLFTLIVYSFIPHKEFRFILPLVPVMILISSTQTMLWMKSLSKLKIYLISFVIMMVSFYAFYFLCKLHQVGTVKVMQFLGSPNNNLLFLMPCHSTPMYSHLHVNIKTRFLRCEPNFTGADDYLEESVIFYNSPMKWLDKEYPISNETQLPTHILFYDVLEPSIRTFLNDRGYESWLRIYHSAFPSRRFGTHILVFNKTETSLQL